MNERKSYRTSFSSLYGDEIYEIINRPPSWITRWGTLLCLGFVFLVIAGCWGISYPDVVSVPIVITASDPPRRIVSRTEGKLRKLLVKDGEQASAGQMLGFCESTTDPYNVIRLELYLKKVLGFLADNDWRSMYLESERGGGNLGEIQRDFQLFSDKLDQLEAYLPGGSYASKLTLLSNDMRDLKELEVNITEQKRLYELDVELSEREFLIHEKLFLNKVISVMEFEREKSKLVAKKIPLNSVESQIIQNRLTQIGKQKEIIELENLVKEQKNSFRQTLQTLNSSVESWKQRYILTSPVEGMVSFSAPWFEQQHIVVGQEIFKIEPKILDVKGIVKIGQLNSGKILKGQKVRIKLDGYPFAEFGILDGVLVNVSLTPGSDSLYWGYVSLPRKLETRYGRVLAYRNDMKGTAEIITKDRNVISRLLDASNMLN